MDTRRPAETEDDMSNLSAKVDDWPEVAKPGGGLPAGEAVELPSADVAGEPAALVDAPGARPLKAPPPAPLVCRARECRADVRKAPMEGRARDVLVDAEATDLGTLVWRRDDAGRYVLRELGRREHVDPGTRRFRFHAETCRGAEAVEKREKAAAARETAGAIAVFEAAGFTVEVIDAPPAPPRRPPVQPRPRPPATPLADVVDLDARRRAKHPPPPPPSRYRCGTPGHGDRVAQLYPGGAFCPECAASRQSRRDR